MTDKHDDYSVLRELGKTYAECAHDPRQRINRENWKRLNGLQPCKPMVMIDQMPWNELNINDELTLRCADPFLRSIESGLRCQIYKWRHLPADMVLDPCIRVPKAIESTGYGVNIDETVSVKDAGNSVVGHSYEDMIPDPAALERFSAPVITCDEAETDRRKALSEEIFDGILPVYMSGHIAYGHIWDVITTFRGVTPVYMDLLERPEFVKETITRFIGFFDKAFDQYERLGLLEAYDLIHCTGAYADELPATDPPPDRWDAPLTTKECWIYSAAQLFSSVSPEMHYEFDIEPIIPLLSRFGLVYYGCCEPLDDKIEYIKRIPNVRKISISPWADPEKSAAQLGSSIVMSRKPNPAVFATAELDEKRVRDEITETLKACRRHDTNCELILKDISTVSRKPENLFRWAKIVSELAEG